MLNTQSYLCLCLRLNLTTGLDALQYALTILVELQLGDDDLRWVDAKRDGLTRRLLLDDTLNVDNVLETVDGGDLAFAALVGAPNNNNFIVLSDRDGADVVLLTEFLAQRCAHDRTSDAGRSIIMGLARLSP